MASGERPVPDRSDPDTGDFWRMAADGRLTYQVFQWLSCSAGNRLAGLKSVPLV